MYDSEVAAREIIVVVIVIFVIVIVVVLPKYLIALLKVSSCYLMLYILVHPHSYSVVVLQ